MAIVIYNPTTPGRRHSSVLKNSSLTKAGPRKQLVLGGKNQAGRNNQGKITVRHRGGGARKQVRVIDFTRDKDNIPATVKTVEYDPGRNSFISLMVYRDGEQRYILTPHGVKVGDHLLSSDKLIELKVGNHMPLEVIPQGMTVCSVELTPGAGAKIARGAGNGVYLMGIDNGYAQLKMPSGEIRLVPMQCRATIGTISNSEFKNIRWGKAGRMRHRGIRPTVRGKVMNPPDHPHGGGEGRNPIGLKHPKTPWGKPALGVKTRKVKRASTRLIIKRRVTKKQK